MINITRVWGLGVGVDVERYPHCVENPQHGSPEVTCFGVFAESDVFHDVSVSTLLNYSQYAWLISRSTSAIRWFTSLKND
jgi:hypothetical protein